MVKIKCLLEKLEDLINRRGMKKDIAFLIISGIAIFLSLLRKSLFPFDIVWPAGISCRIPVLLNAVFGLIFRGGITADVLVSIALSYVLNGHFKTSSLLLGRSQRRFGMMSEQADASSAA